MCEVKAMKKVSKKLLPKEPHQFARNNREERKLCGEYNTRWFGLIDRRTHMSQRRHNKAWNKHVAGLRLGNAELRSVQGVTNYEDVQYYKW